MRERWRASHLEMRAAQTRRYYRTHREQVLEKAKAQRLANPEAKRERDRAYYAEHSDTIKARVRAWEIEHPAEVAERQRIRAGRRRSTAPGESNLTRAEWREIKAGQLGLCAYCFERRPLTLDHIVPVARGGTDTAGNVVGACSRCNVRKSKMTLIVWLARMAQERVA